MLPGSKLRSFVILQPVAIPSVPSLRHESYERGRTADKALRVQPHNIVQYSVEILAIATDTEAPERTAVSYQTRAAVSWRLEDDVRSRPALY